MAEDEYEILPHSSLHKLKSDLENMKSSGSTQRSMNELKDSIDKLLHVFTVASTEMHQEEIESNAVHKRIKPLSDKVDMLIEQNQELAKGLVVIADLVKQHVPKIEKEINSLKIPRPKPSIPIDTPHKSHKPPVDLTKPSQSWDDPFAASDHKGSGSPFPSSGDTHRLNSSQQFTSNNPSRQNYNTPTPGSYPSRFSSPQSPPQYPPQTPPQSPPQFPPPITNIRPPYPSQGQNLRQSNDFGLSDDFDAPFPLPGLDEKPKKKSFLSGLFKK